MNHRLGGLPDISIGIFVALMALPGVAVAGPPLICHPIKVGQAKSLPWSSDGWNLSGKENYDLSRLVEDTGALLTASTPVLVRMETLRRATLYAQKDPKVAKQLLATLQAHAADTEANNRPDALAWFDVGYLVECYKQANWAFNKPPSGAWEKLIKPNPATEIDGYSWVLKAIKLRGDDPEMEFAAALISLEGPQKGHDEQVRKAMAGASHDPLLAENLSSYFLGSERETVAAALSKTTSKN